jgi:hypothetical protein
MDARRAKYQNVNQQDSTAPYFHLNAVEACDPQTDTWESKAPMVNLTWGLLLP